MKLSKTTLFILIWVVHLFIYHTTYQVFSRIAFNAYKEFYNVLFGVFMGLYGLFEQIPLFFIIPIVLMAILINTKLETKWFLAYLITVCIAYLGNYLWMFLRNTHDKVLFSDKNINLIYLILPSLVISILCNWLLFKNQYKRLGA